MGRRGAGTHLCKRQAALPQSRTLLPCLSQGHCCPPAPGTVPPYPAKPRSHCRELGSRETEADPGTSLGEMGHHKCPLQLEGHWTEIQDPAPREGEWDASPMPTWEGEGLVAQNV